MDNDNKNKIINEFVVNIQNNINNISDDLRNDFITYNVNLLKQKIDYDYNVENLLNYFFEIKKIAGDYSLNKIHKLKYFNNDCDIVLIAQYYNTSDEQRHKENAVSLINNLLNPHITKIHLLNEEIYNLDFIFNQVGEQYRNKVKQYVIEKRMTYNDAMAYSNKFCKNSIIIIANLDIFFNDDLNKLQSYDFTNLFLSLSRYEMLHDYEFGGNNQVAKFIHNGTLGNPCIDSHDAWIFKTPIQMTNDSKIMLGSLGCDTIINYVYGVTMNYTVVNPIDSIMTIHYHRERERDYRTENSVRSHSGIIYNKDNKFKSDDYNHKYVLQKTVVVCNKIESFCTFATKNAFKDLRLLLHSLEIYHKDIPIFIYCDDYIAEKIEENNFDLQIHKKIELNKYTNLNRQSMEEQNIFTEFLLNKANVIDYAMETYNNTLFIDADIVILNKMDLLIDKSCDVGLSPHNILEKSEKMYGIYNVGFMYVANKNITNYWKYIIKTKKGFYEQQALDYFEDEFKVFKFDDSYNFGWWRLFQCKDPQVRANLFILEENNIFYSYKTLKCIHTHLYETKDQQTIQFNKFILQLLEKINHPMLKFINNTDLSLENNKNNNNYKSNKKIVSFTQTYGNERYVEILLQKYDKVGQYMRNKCDKIIFSFHNCSLEIIEKSKKYLSDIYDSDKLEFLIYDNMDYLTSIRKTMSYLKSIDVTDILFMNDDEYFLNNDYNLNNLHLLDIIFDYYIKNNITWFSLYGQETPKNKKQKKCIVINDELNIYSYSTLEYKKDNSYAWSQTTALYSLNFCIDLYNNKLPDDSWNIEETFSYYFHTHDYERYGCNIELVRAINLNGHNLSELSLYDNLHRFFFNITDTIYSIVNNINSDKNKTIESKHSKPTIIIPKMPRNDFWHHNNDTFRELLKLWSENKFIDLVEDDIKHVWYNNIGDILLYDRPTLSWLENDTNIKYNKILFGNPIVPDYLKDTATSWIFWGRSPQKLDYYANISNLSYHERTLESIFIGKIENNVQAQYRLKYPNIENFIQLYIMHKPEESYKYNQDEYLSLLKKSKFGLSLRGFGPKCNREIELMALGTVPIVASDVDMCNYYDPLVENVHYFRFNTVDEIKKIIENCDENTWNKMSNACIAWYNKNCSIKGSFETTKKIIENFDSLVNCQKINKKSEIINKKSEIINGNTLECVDDISDKIVFSFGKEEIFSRTNLKSYFSINHIYDCNKEKYNNITWDNNNLFTTIQEKYIAKFENVKVNSEGIMYDNKNIYTLNNKYFSSNLIKQKEVYTFNENCIVFNCVQKNGLQYDRFLCEIYPRLLHIKLYIENNPNINKSIVLLLYYNDTFIKEFLEILNFKNVSICPYNDDVEYVCNTLYLYTPSIYEYPSKDSIDIIRKSLFNNNVCVPRINILIKNNNKNMINNFDNIFDLLKNKYNQYQWIVFDSEDDICKDVVKTIQIFSQANLIIGSHNCGLANMIFSSCDCKILELHPEDCGNMYYWHLSNILKNDYNILSVKNMSKKEIMVNNDQLDYTVNQLLDDIFSVKNI